METTEQVSEICPTCKGKGRWQERLETSGEVELVWHFCENCNGTGLLGSDDDTFSFGSEDDDE